MRHENASAIDAKQFAELMQSFALPARQTIAVAVSGGPDSLALLWLLREWAQANDCSVVALTVDHNLRAASDEEAGQVGRICAEMNIPHHILPWQGDKPDSGIMEAARAARYDLLQGWCASQNIKYLAVAHHADDQAETVLLRFAKGSGVDGLAGMQAMSERGALTILRPLLSVTKERLIATCRGAQLDFIEDPSNRNEDYARPRLRYIMPLLEKEGFSAERLLDLADRMRAASGALQWLTEQALRQTFDNGMLDWVALQNYPSDIQARVLTRILQITGGMERPPKRAQILALLADLRCGAPVTKTLQNCLIRARHGKLHFSREMP